MSKPDKAPGADMEEILASIRRIIADGEVGVSSSSDFSTRTAQAPELAPVELHSPAYGIDEPDDLGPIRGWETPRSDSEDERILELSDEFILADDGRSTRSASGVRATAAAQAGGGASAASARRDEQDLRLERDARPERSLRMERDTRGGTSFRPAAAQGEGVSTSRTQPRQPVSFWSRREPYGRSQGTQPGGGAQPSSLEPARERESAYARAAQAPAQPPYAGGAFSEAAQPAKAESGFRESGPRTGSEPDFSPRQQTENRTPKEAAARMKAPDIDYQGLPPIGDGAGLLVGGPPSESEFRPVASAAWATSAPEPRIVAGAFPGAPVEGASTMETRRPSVPVRSGPQAVSRDADGAEAPAASATSGALTPAASHAPAPIGQSEMVASRSSGAMATRQEGVAARQEALTARHESRSYDHASQTMHAEIMPPSGVNGRSLEDTVKEMLRPMLRQWLNENMPRIVEKVAREEILARTSSDNPDKR